MLTVEIKVNGRVIHCTKAVNQRASDAEGRTLYHTSECGSIYHHREDGAIRLAIKMLEMLQSSQTEHKDTP